MRRVKKASPHTYIPQDPIYTAFFKRQNYRDDVKISGCQGLRVVARGGGCGFKNICWREVLVRNSSVSRLKWWLHNLHVIRCYRATYPHCSRVRFLVFILHSNYVRPCNHGGKRGRIHGTSILATSYESVIISK